MDQISSADVKVNNFMVSNKDPIVSIFGVDPIGLVLRGDNIDEDISDLVAWAYNLGYEKGKEARS